MNILQLLPLFFERIKESKPVAIKGQITGPFTYGTSLVDREKRCAYYDDTLKEIMIKGLTLKALWQVKMFKEIFSRKYSGYFHG